MSRTNKGAKGPGFEYWGKRASGKGKECWRPGRYTKKMTHKKERIDNNKIVCLSYNEFLENEDDFYDFAEDWFHWFPTLIWGIKQEKDMNKEDFVCDNCNKYKGDTLYEGWFYTEAKLNPWLKGTATSGLMQRKIVCEFCLKILQDEGLTKCSKEYVDNLIGN